MSINIKTTQNSNLHITKGVDAIVSSSPSAKTAKIDASGGLEIGRPTNITYGSSLADAPFQSPNIEGDLLRVLSPKLTNAQVMFPDTQKKYLADLYKLEKEGTNLHKILETMLKGGAQLTQYYNALLPG